MRLTCIVHGLTPESRQGVLDRHPEPGRDELAAVAEDLLGAKKPLIVVGGALKPLLIS